MLTHDLVQLPREHESLGTSSGLPKGHIPAHMGICTIGRKRRMVCALQLTLQATVLTMAFVRLGLDLLTWKRWGNLRS